MTPRARSVSHCLEQVAIEFGLTLADITGREQVQPVSSIRQIAMYVAREVTGHTYEMIGRAVGRDHTTVLHGADAVRNQVRKQQWHRDRVLPLVQRLRAELGTNDNLRVDRNGRKRELGTSQNPVLGAQCGA